MPSCPPDSSHDDNMFTRTADDNATSAGISAFAEARVDDRREGFNVARGHCLDDVPWGRGVANLSCACGIG